MKWTIACVAIGILAAVLVAASVWHWRKSANIQSRSGSSPDQLATDDDAGEVVGGTVGPNQPDPQTPHPLLDEADEAVLADDREAVPSTAEPRLMETMRAVVQALGEASEPASLTIDYPLDQMTFPPEIIAPTFLWHEPSDQADTWLVDIALKRVPKSGGGPASSVRWPSKAVENARKTALEGHRTQVQDTLVGDDSEHIYVLSPGNPPATGPIDPACIADSNEIYEPTPYQASAKSWTPSGEVWEAIKQESVELAATVTIVGFSNDQPSKILSRGQMSLTTSQDPVGAPIFYRDVPLAPALTEKSVIKPLKEEAVALIGWRLRDISKTESRLLLTDVPTCTNCHSFSADGKTLGMDLDGPHGDKGAYVITSVTKETKFESEDVISWNSFKGKPEGQKTVGFLSRISPDGQYAITTLNESVYVCNFMNYRFLQVFFPTRGILGYYSQANGEIKALPGADDTKYVHCDAVWTPDGEHLVFARAEAKDPYPEDGKLAERANDPAETQIQYDLYRIPFGDGHGGKPEPIAGASGNGMSNTFPKISPDGKWIVFVKCRNGQLMRPDSTLWIVPTAGGTARRMGCNTRLMNSWHSFSPNSRWMVFSSKANTPYTQMFLTHIDQDGNDSPAILIPNSTAANRAVNIPEFVNISYDDLVSIDVPALEYFRHATRGVLLARKELFDEAIAEFDKSAELEPDFLHVHIWTAVALTKKGKPDEAMARLNKALELDPNHSRAHGNAGFVLAQSGKLDEAIVRLQKALEIDPYYRAAHANLAKIYLEQGKLEQATAHFGTAVELDDDDPLGHFDLGDVLFKRQMFAEAIEQFQKTIAIDPKAIDAHLRLSKAFVRQGNFKAAVAQLQKATRVDVNNVRLVADLAWLLAVCPQDDVRDGAKAVELAKRACAVTDYRSPALLNTLAAAYAEVGNFSEAVATATNALKLVDRRDKMQTQWISQNLERYRAGRPYRAGMEELSN